MRLLVMGGTHHVGRAYVETALALGHEVTTLNRGSVAPAPGVESRTADRTDAAALDAALGTDTWDAVFDTWSSEPVVVQQSARLLADRVGHYGYVSSRSVYTWPIAPGADESAPVVEGDPASTAAEDYAAAKRGGELAVLESFTDRSLLARCGLILGPYEIVGRLPWWLGRIARGGRVPAPGPISRGLQYVDARDLAAFMIRAAENGTTGTFDTVSAPGHTTIGELLDACVAVTGSDAELVWLTPEQVEAAGVGGWTELPIWVPPTGELIGLHEGDTAAARAAGLSCRPAADTVADTWAWLQTEGFPSARSGRAGRLGTSPEQEQALLDQV
ncbi:NAD-dependent epimerase/dehydratase family protein [Nocardioides marmorisolisilvae]|uniref:NAD-dependent epimerase/dehydratase family protein n=1 Tax=Nocardioides marmorisolisilvae TaxID=1542737 RepID=A0A3N0DZE4_9ACTN|nr:NAD-dependent epimerase/dehydratase family protein [Nocardioides marmorisolisilvae]RNL80985.1 NAD-dependent epimerase/dehydratase family protein [Nocardioides marmorisolisilvae]